MATETIRIDRETLESSHLESAGYDPTRQILAVEFKTGRIFHYAPVTPEQAFAFYSAPSKGRHYSQQIKGKIPGERMTGPCANCGEEGWIGDPCTDCGTAVYTAVPFTAKERTA